MRTQFVYGTVVLFEVLLFGRAKCSAQNTYIIWRQVSVRSESTTWANIIKWESGDAGSAPVRGVSAEGVRKE